MADTKITDLTQLTSVDGANDRLVIVDVSDTSMAASGTDKSLVPNSLPVSTATQTALDGKANTVHTHAQSDITNLTTDLAAKAPIADPTFTTRISTPEVKASTSGGLSVKTNGGTEAALIGAGGSNVVDVKGSLNLSAQTASTIAIIDGSKNVTSASTATYPSLTELAYGKGVTGAIQTQIDAVRSTSVQNSQSTAYTLVLGDAGKTLLHPSADTTARTFTIPSNASVAYPVGTVITFVCQNEAGAVTIAITSDTMRLAGAGTTGSRSLAANGIATAIKLTSTEWLISGTGLT